MVDFGEKTTTITKWQALTYHEESTWETDYASVRTIRIDGSFSDDQLLRQFIAAEIESIEEQWFERSRERAIRTQEKFEVLASPVETELGSQLDELELDLSFGGEVEEEARPRRVGKILPHSIDLIEITENSQIHASIFPPVFRCEHDNCSHVQVVEPGVSTLICPCCQKNKIPKNMLTQLSLVFVCPRCAKIDAFSPPRTNLDNARRGMFPCPNNCGGHLHFMRTGSLTTSYWFCSKCPFQITQIGRNCGCGILVEGESGKKEPSPMRLNPTSASNTYGLRRTFVLVDKVDITRETLEKRYKADLKEGKRAWRLSEYLKKSPKPFQELFKKGFSGRIKDAFIVNEMENISVVYGYTTSLTAGAPIEESQRLKQLFREKNNRYRAYMVKSMGKGLVLVMDKVTAVKAAHADVPVTDETSYDQFINGEISRLHTSPFQENLDHPERFPLISMIHTLEHAIWKHATEIVGLDIFGSICLLKDCCIVLFERSDVGSGGLLELTLEEQFLRYLNDIWTEVSGCPQDCEFSCPACLFINDAYCQPFLRDEVNRWYPANSLLIRPLAKRYFEV